MPVERCPEACEEVHFRQDISFAQLSTPKVDTLLKESDKRERMTHNFLRATVRIPPLPATCPRAYPSSFRRLGVAMLVRKNVWTSGSWTTSWTSMTRYALTRYA